ncbi:hypothetical protein [Salipaludibacillus keqinensis]|nr:hypothetical protein [Salipaludibacillus keqinensis]
MSKKSKSKRNMQKSRDAVQPSGNMDRTTISKLDRESSDQRRG